MRIEVLPHTSEIDVGTKLKFTAYAYDLNGIAIPVWASGIAFAVAATLAATLWREARH